MVSAISFAWFADFVKPFTNYVMAIQTCLFLWQALLTQRQILLLYSWRFSRYSAYFHWLVHGQITSNNETVSRQMP